MHVRQSLMLLFSVLLFVRPLSWVQLWCIFTITCLEKKKDSGEEKESRKQKRRESASPRGHFQSPVSCIINNDTHHLSLRIPKRNLARLP